MRDLAHSAPDDTGTCPHCGQPLPAGQGHVHGYGEQKVSRTALFVTILLHLLLLLAFLLNKQLSTKAPPPSGSDITYISPLPGKPQKKEMAKSVPKPTKREKQVVMKIERLKNTITLPNEKPVEKVEPEPPKILKVDPSEDMMANLEAKRKARGQATSEQQGEESEADRGNRIARENIAAANGRSHGDDRNETGGVFDIANKSFSSADVKFRGWNANFKRRWLQQVHVELGTERDIETAIVKKMIDLIRKEKTGDFEWESHRLHRTLTMSARVQDQAELEAFLYKEMFPGYSPPRGR